MADGDDHDETDICGRCYCFGPVRPARCPERPERLRGAPIGMYHCPYCGAMVLAGLPHPPLCGACQPEEAGE